MTHLNIKWCVDHNQPSGVPQPLVDMITYSPELVELQLDLASIRYEQWSPSQFFSALKPRFPQLARVRIGGNATCDWDQLFSESSESTTPTFFECRPQLRELHLVWTSTYFPTLGLTRTIFDHSRFPCLERVSGPIGMILATLSSPIVCQLKGICVNTQNDNPDASISVVEKIGSLGTTLPNLEHLEFACLGKVAFPSIRPKPSSLEKMLTATPNLNYLGLVPVLVWPLKLAPILKEATPRLTELLFWVHETDPQYPYAREAAYLMAEACPKLRIVVTLFSIGSNMRIFYFNASQDGSYVRRSEDEGQP